MYNKTAELNGFDKQEKKNQMIEVHKRNRHLITLTMLLPPLTTSMAYETQRFNADFTMVLQ